MSGRSQTLRRLERLLVLVPWLLEHPGADVAEVSERLGVPAEELLADLDLLGYCGLPGYGGGDLIEVSIVGSAVTVRMADYFRRPLRLSLREALTLLLAARALAGVEGLPESAVLARAAARPESALGATGGAAAAVAVDLGGPGEEHLAPLRDAVAQRRVVRLVHRSEGTGETTEREVEPWALTVADGAWYLQGWCRRAEAPRDFRLDRVRRVEVTDRTAPPPPAPPPPPRYRPEPDDPEVVLDCDPPAWWVAEWAVVEEVVERGEVRRVRLRAQHLDWAARLVLRLEGHARVVSPEALRERVSALAARTLERYAHGV
jgi:predicted DNA-binding transcriptional regulator YafY